MNLDSIKADDIDNIVEYVNEHYDEYLLKLPIKPNTKIYIINEVRHLFEDVDSNLIPKTCVNYYTEACCDCPFLEKECKKVGIPQTVWFHLDSPYITYVQNHWNDTAFDNLDSCFNACIDKYGEELVNKFIKDLNREENTNEQQSSQN